MFLDDEVKAKLLFKLHKRGNWGASHTAIDNIGKGWKDADLGKHGIKRVDKLVRELIREGLILPKPTSYGLQVSLNPRQSGAIMAFMRRFFPEV